MITLALNIGLHISSKLHQTPLSDYIHGTAKKRMPFPLIKLVWILARCVDNIIESNYVIHYAWHSS